MSMLAERPGEYKSFVSAQRDIRLRANLTTPQADAVARLLLEAHPSLADMRKAGQLQIVNSAGQFRVIAVRGGALPDGLSSEDVRMLADAVAGDEGRYAPLWADAQAVAYGRRR
jgi:hypothetical protein